MSEKKNEVVKAAKKLFTEQGIKATTIAQIAEAAGIAKGSVYSSFSSKTEIITAIFEDEFDKALGDLKACLSSGLNGPILLEKYISLVMHQVADDSSFSKVLLSELDNIMQSEVMPSVQSYRQESRALLCQLFESVFGEKIKGWEQDLVVVLDGIIMEYSTYLTVDDFELEIDDCVQFICFVLENTANGLLRENHTVKPVLANQSEVNTQAEMSLIDIVDGIKVLLSDSNLAEKSDLLMTLNAVENVADQLQKADAGSQDFEQSRITFHALLNYLPSHPLWQREKTQLETWLTQHSSN